MTATAASRAGVFATELPPSPYPGLRPFEAGEWLVFFGRERNTDRVIERLSEHGLVVVHGSSGCGKSSLIRAGVLVRLAQEHARLRLEWRSCAMRPGDQPLHNLAEALAGAAGDPGAFLEIRRALNGGRRAAATIAARLGCDARHGVCVLIDQFEEIFRFGREHDREELRLFADALVGFEQTKPPGLQAIVTMRSDFLGGCGDLPGLAETFDETSYLLPRMVPAELIRAIREPARLYGSSVSADLAERLIVDASVSPGDHLSLIQHALRLMWGVEAFAQTGSTVSARGVALDLEAYERAGRLRMQLSAHADRVLKEAAPSAADEVVVQRVFRALTDIDPAGRAVRRPQKLSDLAAVAGVDSARLGEILGPFRRDGVSFLTPYGTDPIGDDTVIDISHEAVIRCWTRISDRRDGWLHREFRDGLIWRALLVHAESFEADSSNTLTPAMTEERETWLGKRSAAWAGRYGGGWERVQALVSASRAATVKKQRTRRAAGLIGLALILGTGILWSILEVSRAKRAGQEALRQEEARRVLDKNRSEARFLARLSRDASRQGNFDSAARFGLAALEANPGEAPSDDTVTALRSAVMGGNVGVLASARANALLVLRDGLVVTGEDSGVLRLWNSGEPEEAAPLGVAATDIKALAETTDGRILSGDAGGRLHAWDRASSRSRQLAAVPGRIFSVTVLARGIAVTYGPRDEETGARTLLFLGAAEGATPVEIAFDRRATAVCKGGDDELVIGFESGAPDEPVGLLSTWSPAGPPESRPMMELPAVVDSLSLVRDGVVVVSDVNGDVSIRDLRTKEREPLESCSHQRNVVRVMPDGSIVLGRDSGEVSVWDPRRKTMSHRCRHTEMVTALDVLPDGRIVSAGGDQVLVSGGPSREHKELFSLGCRVEAMATFPDGRILAAGESGAMLWSPASSRALEVPGETPRKSPDTRGQDDPAAGRDWLRAMAVLPDGRVLISRGGVLQVWKLDAGWEGPLEELPDQIILRAIGVFRDGRVVLGGPGGIRAWEPGQGGSTVLREGVDVGAVAALLGDRIALSAHEGNTLMLLGPDPREMRNVGISSRPIQVLAGLGGRLVVSGDAAGQLYVWDVAERIRTPLGEHGGVTALATFPDGRVVSAGDDGRVLLWEANARPDVAAMQAELRARLGKVGLTQHERRLASR
jgi:WD40 repeat protein